MLAGALKFPLGGELSIVSIAIAPATLVIDVGGIEQLSAIATYDDDSTGDVTSSVVWSSGAPTVIRVTPGGGLITALVPGQVTITATYGSLTATATAVAIALVAHVTIAQSRICAQFRSS